MKKLKLKFHNRFGRLDKSTVSKIIDTSITELLGTLIINDIDLTESNYCVNIGKSSNIYSNIVIKLSADNIPNDTIKWIHLLFNVYIVRNRDQAIVDLNWFKSIQQEVELQNKLSELL